MNIVNPESPCEKGDIIYIQDEVYIVDEIKGNINCRSLETLEFDYFGEDQPYVILANVLDLAYELKNTSYLKKYKDAMKEYMELTEI